MDKIIEEIVKYTYIDKIFLKLGFNSELSNLLALILTFALFSFFIYFVKIVYHHCRTRKTAQDLAPYYDKNNIKQSVKYYISTNGQNFSPTHEEEPCDGNRYIVKKKLIPWFIKDVFREDEGGNKFYLVLADSGMGKSTFMINLFMKYNSIFNLKSKYNIKLLPFGDDRIIDKIKDIGKDEKIAKNTILLLDAFDEYKGLLPPDSTDELTDEERFRKQLDEIFRITRDFRDVIITSRTQYFPGQEDQPYELKIRRFDEKGFHKLSKLYLSPFDQREINKYLNKKYKFWKIWDLKKKRIARKIVESSHKLMVRPMLLAYIDFLVDGDRIFKNTFDIYDTLIKKWIEREGNKRKYDTNSKQLFKNNLYNFSIFMAVEIYHSRKHSPGLSLSKEKAREICKTNNIDLKGYEITGQSLLTRDATGNWKFAHKSIYEFFIALKSMEDISFGFNLDITGLDMTKTFLRENSNESLYLFNYEQVINDRYLQNSFFISREIVTTTNYERELIKNAPGKSFMNKPIASKRQAIEYCNKLNEMFGYQIRYTELGKLIDINGKKIDIYNIKGFRYPTKDEFLSLIMQNQIFDERLMFLYTDNWKEKISSITYRDVIKSTISNNEILANLVYNKSVNEYRFSFGAISDKSPRFNLHFNVDDNIIKECPEWIHEELGENKKEDVIVIKGNKPKIEKVTMNRHPSKLMRLIYIN